MDFSKFYLHNLVTLFIKVFKKLDPICQPNVHCSKRSKSSHNMKLHGMDQKKLVCDEIFECLFLESELVFETYLYKWNIICQKYLQKFNDKLQLNMSR